jgi:hypothetical protein
MQKMNWSFLKEFFGSGNLISLPPEYPLLSLF